MTLFSFLLRPQTYLSSLGYGIAGVAGHGIYRVAQSAKDLDIT